MKISKPNYGSTKYNQKAKRKQKRKKHKIRTAPQWLTSSLAGSAIAKQTELSTLQSQHHSSAPDQGRRQHTIVQAQEKAKGKELAYGGGYTRASRQNGNEAEAANVCLCKASDGDAAESLLRVKGRSRAP